jgi:hypothetical protein
MELLEILAFGALMIASYVTGAKLGQKVAKDEKIELPKINPLEIYKQNQEKKEAQKEQEELETILGNIERYDGTGTGQQDIPRR